MFCQVCDSDTMLDPASSVEMVKVLEEDPMVGGVGGDVQVTKQPYTQNTFINSVFTVCSDCLVIQRILQKQVLFVKFFET